MIHNSNVEVCSVPFYSGYLLISVSDVAAEVSCGVDHGEAVVQVSWCLRWLIVECGCNYCEYADAVSDADTDDADSLILSLL